MRARDDVCAVVYIPAHLEFVFYREVDDGHLGQHTGNAAE